MTETIAASDLTNRVWRLVRSYVFTRTERKCGISWDSFRDRKIKDPQSSTERIDVPQKYRDARESICQTAFLRVRSCHSREDFIDYFTGTICSVPQFLPEDEYTKVSLILLDENRWEEMKALTMLALSGVSRL
jgi:CRISPR-associated protein Cmx8